MTTGEIRELKAIIKFLLGEPTILRSLLEEPPI